MSFNSWGINTTHQNFQLMYITLFYLKGLKSYSYKCKWKVLFTKENGDIKLWRLITFDSLVLEKSYIRHLKALMCGINASRGQGHGCRFTMCHASLKMALLLHKEGLVKTTVPITVIALHRFVWLFFSKEIFKSDLKKMCRTACVGSNYLFCFDIKTINLNSLN